MSNSFKFSSEVWEYNGDGSWHFVTLPKDLSEIIKSMVEIKRGFGSVKVIVVVGNSKWQTSIFPDTKSESYILPLKKEIRVKEKIVAGDNIEVIIFPMQV